MPSLAAFVHAQRAQWLGSTGRARLQSDSWRDDGNDDHRHRHRHRRRHQVRAVHSVSPKAEQLPL